MRSLTPFAAVGLLAGCLLVLPSADPARGCAVVPPVGSRVDISAESAVIVWDAATKTEHFTRRARFASTAADFGFLVPTPSVPDLSEADDTAFRTLESLTAPRVVYETRTVRQFGCESFKMSATVDAGNVKSAAPPPSAAVSVLKQQRVGQFDAAVLKADDPKALREWLEKNGYPARPQLDEWLKKYTDDKWVITAFKIAGADRPTTAGTALPVDATTVRMTFKTETPFYPYREPADARAAAGGDRFLRVYFLSDKRYTGTLGAAGEWPSRAVWANAVDPPKGVGATADSGRTWWLTEFEDRSSPRPGTDEVYFAPATDQSALERPPIIHTTTQVTYWPGWGGVSAMMPLLAIVGLYLFWRLTRRPAG